MKINWILGIALMFLAFNANAYVDHNIIIQGRLKTLEEKIAIVETDKGPVSVPAKSVRNLKYHPGQNVMVYVDIHDFVALNADRFKKAGLMK